jgi:hypothetical protein
VTTSDLEGKLQVFGLHLRGVVKLSSGEVRAFDFDADEIASIALVGNRGSSYWPVFERSVEYLDGRPHPLDRWSRRIGEQLADELGATAIFPFEGPPYAPFQQWAKRAESLHQSPMGMMIHPQYGLWHSYRFGLLMPAVADTQDEQAMAGEDPCQNCATQPCLNTCPVGALDAGSYQVDSCAGYLKRTKRASCHSEGCMARSACPVGVSYQYDSTQHAFHLSAFLASR